MAATPGGLTTSIRRKLQDGKAPEEIVQELVAGGLGQVSAQRFVDRALAEDATAPPLPVDDAPAPADALDQFIQTKTAETEAENAKTGGKSLWAGSLLMCGGILITAVSYIMADPGERFTLMWGPVLFGFLLWGKAVLQGVANFRTFAWFSAAGSFAAPVVLAIVMLGVAVATEPIEEEELAQDERAEVEPISTFQPGEGPSLETLLGSFDGETHPQTQCEVANMLTNVPSDRKSEVITGLVARYNHVPDAVQPCIRRTVAVLDPSVRLQ
jgi:hypothetical protein